MRMADRAFGPDADGPARKTLLSLRGIAMTRAQRTALVLVAVLVAVIAAYAPVLGNYFFNDDFVPLADITSRTTPGYIRDLFLMRDLTPNWRFLTGLYYLGAYRAFELNAFPYFLVAVLVHLATAGLIFWFVRRALGSDWPAFVAAAFFGLAAGPVPTVAQVTAFNNVLATFFLMLAIVLLYEGLAWRTNPAVWLLASAAAFAAAIASNESAMIVAPVFGLIVLWKLPRPDRWLRQPRAWLGVTIASLPFALLGAIALAAFEACHCTEASKSGVSSFGSHMAGSYWVLLGRLLYPIGMEPPGEPGRTHMAAGIAVAVVGVGLVVRGPALGRIAAAFLFLALLPNSMITFALAERYAYVASAPFAIVVSVLFFEAARFGRRLTPALPVALAALACGVIALNGWQTWTQNQRQARAEDNWRALVTALQDAYPSVPPETTVYVRGGPVTDPLAQCAVMPSLAHVLWGNDRLLFTLARSDLQSYLIRPGYTVYVGDYVDGRIVPAPATVATTADLQRKDVKLLPMLSPKSTGNICLSAIPATQ
jgi:hypothetical protein